MSDVVVAGAGIAGATLALALKRALGDGLKVMLADPALAQSAARVRSFRALAVAPDARECLEMLGIWSAVARHAQPIRAMVITDSRPGALPNPVFLRFEGGAAESRTEALAHMVLADRLRYELLHACVEAGVIVVPEQIVGFVGEPHALSLVFSDGRREATRLLAAADGGRSRLRHVARIQTVDADYPQSAIIATLHHSRDHEGQAIQHFLPAGPIALLPLRADDGSGRRTSIVWTDRHAAADGIAALPAEAFVRAFEDRVGLGLGTVTLEDRPLVHPLRLMLARRMTAPRFALVGDAARTIHPLAGQGLNLGLRDAAALAQQVVARAELGLDPGGREVLEGYERDRLFGSAAIAAATNGLNRLFSNDRMSVRTLRDIGLGLVDRSPGAKRLFIDQAVGRPLRID